jgi:hypothetical protein
MVNKSLIELKAAAQAVIERWDSPLWKDLPATADYIHRLRKALAAMGDASTRKDEGGTLTEKAQLTSPDTLNQEALQAAYDAAYEEQCSINAYEYSTRDVQEIVRLSIIAYLTAIPCEISEKEQLDILERINLILNTRTRKEQPQSIFSVLHPYLTSLKRESGGVK